MKTTQLTDDVTMALETENGQWHVTIDRAVIRTKKQALLVAKNLKQLARMLPDSMPRQRQVMGDAVEPSKPQRAKAKKKLNAESAADDFGETP